MITREFLPSEADPDVVFNDSPQIAAFDPGTDPKGLLVLPFGGAGMRAGTLGAEGEFCARHGFHVLGVAAFQDYTIVTGDAAFYGDARRSVLEGSWPGMVPADGVAVRSARALAHLGWDEYLCDGAVCWDRVILTGVSHGASNAARFAMLVPVARVVSFAGPRDNVIKDGRVVVAADWLGETPATPIERFYAVTGRLDTQHAEHLYAMERLGYLGEPVVAARGVALDGARRIVLPDGGHVLSSDPLYEQVCEYVFSLC